MPGPISNPSPVRVSVVGLTLLLLLVVLLRSPAEAPPAMDTAGPAASDRPSEPKAGVSSAQQSVGGTNPPTLTETDEPPSAAGCFGTGSTRAEVQAVMGTPDTVVFGEWLYGRSGVTFGYGTVLDIRNDGGNLRLC